MFSMRRRKVWQRACQLNEEAASGSRKDRTAHGSRPQTRKACRMIAQRSRASQQARPTQMQAMPSGVGDRVAVFGQYRRTWSDSMQVASASRRAAAASQISHSGKRSPFMGGSIGEV
jgi:hypothetical protein